jgi:hypothetical protein
MLHHVSGHRGFNFSGLLAMALTAFLAQAAQAKPPIVRFDMGHMVECRDITPPSPAGQNNDEKLIEAKIRISILVADGHQEDVDDVLVTIDSPTRRLRVAEFFPKTELAETVKGEVETTRTTEDTATATATLTGLHGLAIGQLGGIRHNVVNHKFTELPAKCMVLASGTTGGEHGVFFKVKGSPQHALEGAQQFTVVFQVPKHWRGDWCVVSCQARTLTKHCMTKKLEVCGQSEAYLGLYLAGDDESRALARKLDRVQTSVLAQLRAGQSQDEIAASSFEARPVSSHKHFDLVALVAPWSKSGPTDRQPTAAEAALPRALEDLSGLADR